MPFKYTAGVALSTHELKGAASARGLERSDARGRRVLLISPARGLERSNARKLVCRCGEIFNLQETARDSPDYFDMLMIE